MPWCEIYQYDKPEDKGKLYDASSFELEFLLLPKCTYRDFSKVYKEVFNKQPKPESMVDVEEIIDEPSKVINSVCDSALHTYDDYVAANIYLISELDRLFGLGDLDIPEYEKLKKIGNRLHDTDFRKCIETIIHYSDVYIG